MSRHQFGGDQASWAFTTAATNAVYAAPLVTVTFWSAQTGGTQYTDLASAADGSGPMSQVITGSGSGSAVGIIPTFYGPDGVVAMWASANGEVRRLMISSEVPALVGTANTFTTTQLFSPAGDVNAQAARFRAQAGQVANVFEQLNSGGTAVSWMDPNGLWRAPNLGHTFTLPPFAGTLTVQTGVYRIYNDTGVTLTIRAVRASVGTAPTGAAIRVDVNKNGTTIFTTQGNRPNIAVSTFTSKVTNMDVTTLADGDYLTADVDVIGSTVAGSNLLVHVLCS